MAGSHPSTVIHEAILLLCKQLKDDAVSLVDVLAPTDFILNSPIGASDGEVSCFHFNLLTLFCCFLVLLKVAPA